MLGSRVIIIGTVKNAEGDFALVLSTPLRHMLGFVPVEVLSPLKPADSADPLGEGARFQNVTGMVGSLMRDPANYGAVFQVASQFNCLEMVGPKVTPKDGISRYANDKTQGPRCAMTCAAGTVYRNYFVTKAKGTGKMDGSFGVDGQINLLCDVEKLIQNEKNKYWVIRNGYCLPTDTSTMAKLGQRLQKNEASTNATDGDSKQPTLRQKLVEFLQVGVHWETEVEAAHESTVQRVAQVFCSAMPVAYAKSTKSVDWREIATVALKGAYGSTLLVGGLLALCRGVRTKVYLTSVGGGAFGNKIGWIHEAIKEMLVRFHFLPIDVFLVQYMRSAGKMSQNLQKEVTALLKKRKQKKITT